MKFLNMVLAMLIVSFIWDPNTEPDLIGYRLYQGVQSMSYPTQPEKFIPCGPNDSTCANTSIDPPPGEYFWVLTAVDSEGYESEYSVEQTTVITGGSLDEVINLIITDKE